MHGTLENGAPSADRRPAKHVCGALRAARIPPPRAGGRGDGPRAAGAGTGGLRRDAGSALWQPDPADFGDPVVIPRAPAPCACRLRSGVAATWPLADALGFTAHSENGAPSAFRPSRIPIRPPAVAATDRGPRAQELAAGVRRRQERTAPLGAAPRPHRVRRLARRSGGAPGRCVQDGGSTEIRPLVTRSRCGRRLGRRTRFDCGAQPFAPRSRVA